MAFGVVLAGGTIGALTIPTAAAAAGNRTVTDPVTGQTITILNEGDCSTLDVTTSGGSTSQADYANMTYTVNTDCTVSVQNGYWTTTPPSESGTGNANGAPAGDSPQAGYVGNWINTSQTLQDVINIDIAKLRFHVDRRWNGTNTVLSGAYYLRNSTSISWNHTSGQPYINSMDSGTGVTRNARGSGQFHSDFLWCNFEAGQNFVMTTSITSKKNGDFDRSYSQNRQCAGTHKATSSNTSASPPSGW